MAKKSGNLLKIKMVINYNWIHILVYNIYLYLSKKYSEYNNNRRVGKNLIFKNLKTNDYKTIQDFLKMSDFELMINGLQKVYNPKRGWYIKKIRNNIKEDNLG
ncbi:hypothetical protein [Mycoplasma leonicaptivi]|uniref:hypothetical protein n=1 Tax=Mycoplasma leonicaptivi TaxID=36742 RepID=UPI000483C61A|nr:hypothetical protein [Mycoplasma leonicaptivi]